MLQVYVTDKVNEQLTKAAKVNEVTKEGLCNILLALALTNESSLVQAVKLIKLWSLGGTAEQEKRGL